MDTPLRTFTVVSEVGDEYTVDEVNTGGNGGGPLFGPQGVQFIARGLGRLVQLKENLFQAESRPELVLTTK